MTTTTTPKRASLEKRLHAVRKARKLSEVTVNRDWVQAQVLGAIARHAVLRTTLVFKGGTALQKMFFGEDFRFSQDLDFTSTDGAPKGDDLGRALEQACSDGVRHIKTVLGGDEESVGLTCVRKVEKEVDPSQEAFHIRFKMPWQRRDIEYVKLEVTYAAVEPLVLPAKARALCVTYGDVEADVLTYSLEEIVLEKLRAAPQTIAARDKRAKKGVAWMKPRSRDFFDLWHIAKLRSDVDWKTVRANLDAKCAARGVTIKSIDDVFIADIVERVKEEWAAQLADFVPEPLPAVEPLLEELRSLLSERLGWA